MDTNTGSTGTTDDTMVFEVRNLETRKVVATFENVSDAKRYAETWAQQGRSDAGAYRVGDFDAGNHPRAWFRKRLATVNGPRYTWREENTGADVFDAVWDSEPDGFLTLHASNLSSYSRNDELTPGTWTNLRIHRSSIGALRDMLQRLEDRVGGDAS